MSEEARGYLAEPAGSAAAGVLVVPDPGQAEALADAMDRPAARAADRSGCSAGPWAACTP